MSTPLDTALRSQVDGDGSAGGRVWEAIGVAGQTRVPHLNTACRVCFKRDRLDRSVSPAPSLYKVTFVQLQGNEGEGGVWPLAEDPPCPTMLCTCKMRWGSLDR
jgi:hypothetical protein